MSYNTDLQGNNAELQAILDAVNALPEAGDTPPPSLQNKTVTPAEYSQSIAADEGYDGLEVVTVEPIPANYKDISAVTVTPETLAEGVTAIDATGKLIVGTAKFGTTDTGNNVSFVPNGADTALICADGSEFMCKKEDV